MIMADLLVNLPVAVVAAVAARLALPGRTDRTRHAAGPA
jgi:hypothetical protein